MNYGQIMDILANPSKLGFKPSTRIEIRVKHDGGYGTINIPLSGLAKTIATLIRDGYGCDCKDYFIYTPGAQLGITIMKPRLRPKKIAKNKDKDLIE